MPEQAVRILEETLARHGEELDGAFGCVVVEGDAAARGTLIARVG
jgi:hypothetical protein